MTRMVILVWLPGGKIFNQIEGVPGLLALEKEEGKSWQKQ